MKYIKQEKLEKINLEANNMYVAIDFDRTITANNSTDSWDAASSLLGMELKEEFDKLYKIYRPIEMDYTISFEEKNKAMECWYKKCMEKYYKYNLTKEQLEKSVMQSGVIFRKGAKEFLLKMAEKKIPVIILSAGIGNVIEIFLKANNCYFENMYIISNFLTFNKNGKIEPYNKELIHTMNKTMKGHLPEKLEQELKTRKYKVLFGDTIEDKKMIEESEHENTILVGFLTNNIEENLEKYKNEFDICCVGNEGFPEINIKG